MQKLQNYSERNKGRAFLLAVLANVLWASSFLGSKYTLAAWGPVTASLLRFALATLILGTMLPLMGEVISLPRKKDLKGIFLIGLCQFGLLYPFQLAGLNHISTSLSAAIMLLAPLFVIVCGKFFLKESVSKTKLNAIFLGLFGGLTLLKDGFSIHGNFYLGFSLTLISSVLLGLSVILTRKYSQTISVAQLSFWTMLTGVVLLTPMSFIESQTNGGFIRSSEALNSAFLALLYLAIICSAFTFYIWNTALKMAPAKELASTMHLKTPTAIIIGVLLASEEMTSTLIIGTAIISFAVWVSQHENSFAKFFFKEPSKPQSLDNKVVKHASNI